MILTLKSRYNIDSVHLWLQEVSLSSLEYLTRSTRWRGRRIASCLIWLPVVLPLSSPCRIIAAYCLLDSLNQFWLPLRELERQVGKRSGWAEAGAGVPESQHGQ